MLDLKRVVVLGALLGLGLANSCKQRQNDKPEPNGNPTKKPSLGDIVPVGEPYEISWNVREILYPYAVFSADLCSSQQRRVQSR